MAPRQAKAAQTGSCAAAVKPGWAARTFTFALLALQGISVLLSAHLWAHGGAREGLSTESLAGMAVMFFVFPSLGVAGVVWAILGAWQRWESRTFAAALLVVSFAMSSIVAPELLSQKLGSLMEPLARRQIEAESRKEYAEYRHELRVHYDSLLERFRRPRRVVAMRPGYLLLDDQSAVKLLDFYDFGSWSPNLVVGKEVEVVLPDRETFESHYQVGARDGFLATRPSDPVTKTRYGTVPAFVIFNGELLNKRFARYPEMVERFFREHAAVSGDDPTGSPSSHQSTSTLSVSGQR